MLTLLRNQFTIDWKQVDWPRTALLIALILALYAAGWQYVMPRMQTLTATEFRRVAEIRTVAAVQRVYVPCPEQGIVVLDKAAVARKLDLSWLQGGDIDSARKGGDTALPPEGTQPGAILASPPGPRPRGELYEVTATADLPESGNGIEAVSVIDMRSGESHIEAREKEAPWFQFRNEGALGVKYGYNQHLQNIGTVYGRWDFLRIKSFFLSANADLETGGDARLQAGVEYRW